MLNQLKIKNKILLSFIVVAACIMLLGIYVFNNVSIDAAILAGGIGLSLLLYLIIRLFLFNRRLQYVLKELAEDDFDVALKMPGDGALDSLANSINQLILRFKKFDNLRAGRVKTSTRLLNTVTRGVQRGIMIGYLADEVLRLNPAAQKIFGIGQDEIALDAIMRIPDNANFAEMFQRLSKKESVSAELTTNLKMPIGRRAANVHLKFVIVKDDEENARFVVILVDRV